MIDPTEIDALVLQDFGEDMSVTKESSGETFPLRMLFDEESEDSRGGSGAYLGESTGAMSSVTLRCWPTDAAKIEEGDRIQTPEGEVYAVYEVTPKRKQLTDVEVIPA
jgi:hypothetical protein